MPRIQPNQNPSKEAQGLLDAVKGKLGKVPNIFKTMAHSPVVLEAYLNFSGTMAKGKLSAALREQIALTVGGANRCDYCASAHTAIGKMQKISDAELAENLLGKSSDAKVQAALTFARKIVDNKGNLTDADLIAIRGAGYSEEEILEIFGVVTVNIFTNYFNHMAGTEIDFPVVSTAKVRPDHS